MALRGEAGVSVGAEITETRQVAKFPTSAPPDAPETSLHALVPILVRADLARQQNWCGPGLAKYRVHMQMACAGWIGIGIGWGGWGEEVRKWIGMNILALSKDVL